MRKRQCGVQSEISLKAEVLKAKEKKIGFRINPM